MNDSDELDKLARKVNNNINNNRTNIDKYLTGQYDKGTKNRTNNRRILFCTRTIFKI